MALPRFRAAFPDPPHVQDPSGLIVAWFTNPAGAIIQFARPGVGSMAIVRWLCGPAREQLERRFPEGPLLIVMDYTLMTGRDPAVRSVMLESAKALKPRVKQTVIIPPQEASRIYLATLKAAAAILAAAGIHIQFHKTIAFTIGRLGLSAAEFAP